AVDELVGLGEELDLADSAAPALEVETRPGLAGPAMGVADSRGQAADFLERGEVEAAPPDKRADGAQELLAGGDVPGRRTGPDKGRALPRQSGAFVVT